MPTRGAPTPARPRHNPLTPSNPSEFTGIYILHNMNEDKYYVGQSVRVLNRVRQHFTGHGNGDILPASNMETLFQCRQYPSCKADIRVLMSSSATQ